MDKVLQTLNVKLDSTMQTLTERAIGQLLVKIIFHHSCPITEKELIKKYKTEVKSLYNEARTKHVLTSLISENDVKYENNKYRLSSSKIKNIERNIENSNLRLNNIIDKFFTELYTSKEIIKECLIDAITHFFETYSNEWIADINYQEQYIFNSKDNIVRTIGSRINANKKIDTRDKKQILNRFIDFITTRNDIDVDAFLWEYGTSAFAAKLIKVSNSSDTLSINKFSNSKCVLDTNILMNIGLEASKYSAAISSIEKAFIKLNIRVGILNITRNEYEHTIINKRNTVLNLVSKGYSNEVLEAIDDQYLQTAIERKCDVLEDFERFFDQIGSVPKLFDNELDIEIFDHDEDLEETIELHQCDERNLENLNAIYRKVTQRDKNTNSLKHDVGMIAGAEYLRTKEKTFILSQEVSVNNFSKSLPLEDGLPLSIKLETLINVLSINMDGLSSDDNFVGLFASMIRSGLTVHKDLFKPEDLCYMLEQDELVTQLPADITINIANKIHSMRVKGESDKDIHLTLTREITGGKLKIKTDLDKANLIVSNLTREKNRNAERLKETEAIIYNMAKTDSLKEWKNDVRSQYLKLLFSLIATLILTYILFKILNIEQSNISLFWNGMICIAFNIITNCLWYIFGILPNINHLQKNKEKIIKAKIEEKTKYENI